MVRTGILAIVFMVTAAYGHADTFVLVTGEQFEGTIIRSMGNSLTIKLDDAGMRQIPQSDIAKIELILADGKRISGRLSSWFDGTYLILRQGQTPVEVRDGVSTEIIPEDKPQPTDQEQSDSARSHTVQPTM